MKRRIIVSVCVLLGLIAGYFAAPIASMAYLHATDAKAVGTFIFFLMANFTECNCTNQLPSERVKDLTKYVSTEQELKDRSPESKMLPQLIGLTEVRISLLEQQLGHSAASDEAMKRGRGELTGLGWKDVSPEHLTAVVAQIDSECRPPDPKVNTAAKR